MQTHYLSCEVFQDSCAVHRCCSTNTTVARGSSLQMSVDTSYRELKQTREIKIRSNMSIKNTVHNFEVNAIKICPTPPSCVNRKYNKRKNKKKQSSYIPADQLSGIQILLWLQLYHCPFQPFLLPVETELHKNHTHTKKS